MTTTDRLAGVALATIFAVATAVPVLAEPTGTVLHDGVAAPADLVISDAEREAAADAAAGGLAGIIVPSLAYGYFRSLVEPASERLESLGLTVEVCEARTATGLDATDCLNDLVERGARVIIATTVSAEAMDTATQAIADGTVIVQVNIANLSEAGAPRVAVADPTESLAGVAAETAAQLWGEAPVDAVILGDPDIPAFADFGLAVEEALAVQAPQVTVMGHRPGRLPSWARDSVDDALLGGRPPGMIIGLVEYGIASAAAEQPDVAFVSAGCSPAVVTAVEAGGSFKGCARSSFPEESGAIAADLATRLLAGGEVPGSLLIPVTTQLQDPMSELGTTVPGPGIDDPRLAACGERIAMLPSELDGEALTYELVDGHQAVESGELPAETLIRLHLANGSGLSEDGICLVRFAYGDGHDAHGTLWALEGEFTCGEDDTSSECQVDRYLGGLTELSVPGARVKSSRPMVADQRVTVLKLPKGDLFAVRVGKDLPAREVVVARVGDTFATLPSRDAAEKLLPILPDPAD